MTLHITAVGEEDKKIEYKSPTVNNLSVEYVYIYIYIAEKYRFFFTARNQHRTMSEYRRRGLRSSRNPEASENNRKSSVNTQTQI